MTRKEELNKQKIDCIQKIIATCENLKLVKDEKQCALKDKKVFYNLISGVIFLLLAIINIIPALFLTSLASKICLFALGGTFFTLGSVFSIKTVKNYIRQNDEFAKQKIEQTQQYQQDLQELNSQIAKINYELNFLNEVKVISGYENSDNQMAQVQSAQNSFEKE